MMIRLFGVVFSGVLMAIFVTQAMAIIKNEGSTLAASARQFPANRGSYPNFTETERTVMSEQREDGMHHKVTITKKVRIPYEIQVEKHVPQIVEVPVDKPFNVYIPKPYPVVVEKKVPYTIKVPVPQPYMVEKKIPYSVKVLVDKPYAVQIPKPYPVRVDKKYEFAVEKKVPYEVKVPVERPYPVPFLVEKEVKVPVEAEVPVPVKVPFEKPVPVEVEKHVPVLVDKPIPYSVEQMAPYAVKVPYKIPVEVNYPVSNNKFRSAENKYHREMSRINHNAEWTDAMASMAKEVKSRSRPVEFSYPDQNPQYSTIRSHRHRGYILDKYVMPQIPYDMKRYSSTELPILGPTPSYGTSHRIKPSYQVIEEDNRHKFTKQGSPNRGIPLSSVNYEEGNNLQSLLSPSPQQFPNSQQQNEVNQQHTSFSNHLQSRIPNFQQEYNGAPPLEYGQRENEEPLNHQKVSPWDFKPSLEVHHSSDGDSFPKQQFPADRRLRFPYSFQLPTLSNTQVVNTGHAFDSNQNNNRPYVNNPKMPRFSPGENQLNFNPSATAGDEIPDSNNWSPLHSYNRITSYNNCNENCIKQLSQRGGKVFNPKSEGPFISEAPNGSRSTFQRNSVSSTPSPVLTTWSQTLNDPHLYPIENKGSILTIEAPKHQTNNFVPSAEYPSSFVGSKTFLGNQEVSFSSSVQHNNPYHFY